MVKRSNVTLVIKFWYLYIYKVYKTNIDNHDITFFDIDFLKNGSTNSTSSDIFIIISNISQLLYQLDDICTNQFMLQIYNISKLSELYHNSSI